MHTFVKRGLLDVNKIFCKNPSDSFVIIKYLLFRNPLDGFRCLLSEFHVDKEGEGDSRFPKFPIDSDMC